MPEKFIMGNAIEGESYVGKTTAIEKIKNIENIKERDIIVVPEYSVIGRLPSFPRMDIDSIKKSIQQMIDLEKKRTDVLAKNLSQKPFASVVFDRGPISCIAFEYAAERNGYKGAALWIAEAFQKEIENKNIIIPGGMIFLTADKGFIEERKVSSLASGHGRIIDFLQDGNVIKTLNEVFKAFGDFLPKQLFLTLDTGNKNPQEVGAEVLQFIKGQPADVMDNVPNFVEYANSLIKNK